MYCRHFEFGNITWSRVDQSDNFRRWRPAHFIRNLKINLDDYLEKHSVGITQRASSRNCVTKSIKIEIVGTVTKLSETDLFATDRSFASASNSLSHFFDILCTATTWNVLIQSFQKDANTVLRITQNLIARKFTYIWQIEAKVPFTRRKRVQGSRVTRLPELPRARQLFLHLTYKSFETGKENKSWLATRVIFWTVTMLLSQVIF